ncbi:MAG: VWA domain-containing protein [Myxococcota bacterium]
MTVLYILKLRRRRVQVPFSPLWSRVVEERQSSSLFRALKRIGSLLVQWLVIALVVLALGDPHLGGGFAGCDYAEPTPTPPRHTLVMVDASASMATVEEGRTRLERARAKAHALVDKLATEPSQQMMIVQVDALTRPLSLWSSEPSVLHAAIDQVAGGPTGEALDTPTGVDDALRFAEDALRGREGGETVWVSDMAFAPIPEARQKAIGMKIEGVGPADVGADSGDNLGIGAFNVRPYLDDSLTYAAWYEVRNDTAREVKAQLFLYANPDGRSESDFIDPANLVQTVALTLPAHGVVRDVATDVKFSGSRLCARLATDSRDPTRDVFPRDDVAFAVVPPRRMMNVQLVTPGNLFINAALFLRENVKLTVVAPDEYKGPEGFDVTVVDGVDVDLTKGGNFFVLGPQPGGAFPVTGVVKEPQPARVDQKHPLARFVKFVDLNILEAPIIATEKGDQVVVAAQNGAPLLFARRVVPADGGPASQIVVLTFDIRKSLFPMSYAFPLLVVNTLNWFYQDPEGLLKPNRAGVPLSLPFPFEGKQLTVTPPAGVAPPVARRVGDRVQLTAPRLGIYDIAAQSAEATPAPDPAAAPAKPDATKPATPAELAVAVNLLSPEESQVSARPEAKYATWVAPTRVERAEENPWLANVWRTLLLAALAVVVLEWLTWHRRVTV